MSYKLLIPYPLKEGFYGQPDLKLSSEIKIDGKGLLGNTFAKHILKALSMNLI